MVAPKPSVRLFFIVARAAPVAVVFRRGPSRQVLLLRWDVRRDVVEAGQWFRGRIYERRCDLTPDGERLVYFAAGRRRAPESWTAISRPPYLTALALWPKGDSWGGGGLFASDRELLLNHPPSQRALGEGFNLPRKLAVGALPTAGAGEDDPIFRTRMARDGWTLVQEGNWIEQRRTSSVWYASDPPELWSRPCPRGTVPVDLQMALEGVREQQGPKYITRYLLRPRARGAPSIDLGRADWADWCVSGDLLLARDGKLLRGTIRSATAPDAPATFREVADLTCLSFHPLEAPPEAKTWTGRPPLAQRISTRR